MPQKLRLSHLWGVFPERQVTCRITFFTCRSLVFSFFSVWFWIWQTIKTVPLVMTFKNNTHPKIQKWYHFASPKSDQIWSHSTCWNYSFKKLVTFEKKWKVSKFFLSLAAQNKSSFDIAFFLVKTKTNMWMILNKERSTSWSEKNCKRDKATWDTFSAIFVLQSSKYWAVE